MDRPYTGFFPFLAGLVGGIFSRAANSLMVRTEVRLLSKANGVFTCEYIAGEFGDYW
jgi:hypothetical protein